MSTRFPTAVAQALTEAGWHDGVRIPEGELQGWFRALGHQGMQLPPAAIAALWEFGGMTIHQYGPGVDMSRMPFRIDPLVGLYAGDVMAAYGASLGRALVPVGEYDLGRGRLAMDARGIVYLFWGDLWKVADSFDAALVALIEGHRPTRLDLAPATAPLPARPADEARARELARLYVVGGGPGTPTDVVLREFDLGWLVIPVFADSDPLANVGAGYSIVDRRNSRVTSMPSLPPDMVLDMYRERFPNV